MDSELIQTPISSIPFWVSSAACVLIAGALLCLFVSPLAVIIPLAVLAYLWLPFRRPLGTLGFVLAYIPLDFMVIALGKFFGLPHMTLVSILDKEVILLLLTLVLWQKNGFKLCTPDWFLLACFAFAVVRTIFGGTLDGLVTDFGFMVPYFAGRVTVLNEDTQRRWAARSVWIAGVLAMLGLIEVFILGEGPRTILYLAIDSETEGGQLTSSFHATGFAGLREAATMIGPNGFGALCMIGLILWWVYCRNPLPAGMVAVGLICSVTRSAWAGAVAGISIVAITMGQSKRLLLYASLALVLFAAAIPVLGLGDYLFATKSGQDLSEEGHKEQIFDGLEFAANHPFGAGNEDLSPVSFKQNTNTILFETTYPYVAAAYGIVVALCLLGFLMSTFFLLLRVESPLGHAALGILVGMATVMVFTLPLIDRRLGCWAWFPVGMAVRSAVGTASRFTSGLQSGEAL